MDLEILRSPVVHITAERKWGLKKKTVVNGISLGDLRSPGILTSYWPVAS
jgi:hypothetical protein